MSTASTERKDGQDVVMTDEKNDDDSSPDSTPLAAGRTRPLAAEVPQVENSKAPGDVSVGDGKDGKSKTLEKKEESEKQESRPEPLSKSAALAKQIQALNSLRRRVAALRDVPGRLITLQSPPRPAFGPVVQPDGIQDTDLMLNDALSSSGPVATQAAGDETIDSLISSAVNMSKPQPPTSLARGAFQAVNEARSQLLSELVQVALTDADLSFANDKSEIIASNRRERKKRKFVLAESPAPFPSLQVQTPIVFPADQENHKPPFTYNDLLPYLRQRGRGSDRGRLGIKLNIWTKSKASRHNPQVSEPLTLRAKIQDVVTVFLSVTFRSFDRDPIIIESAVALGPREKKSPYSHSDYAVYQKLTQCILRMIEQEPTVSLPQMINHLTSYESLFDDRCSVCERILSQEGHIPPVARVWTDTSGGKKRWDPRHVSCLHA